MIPYSFSAALLQIKELVKTVWVCFYGCTSKWRRAIFMDTFIFHPNQPELVREQHLCWSLRESLDGIVITDHRLILRGSCFRRVIHQIREMHSNTLRESWTHIKKPQCHPLTALNIHTHTHADTHTYTGIMTCRTCHVWSLPLVSMETLTHLHYPVKTYQCECVSLANVTERKEKEWDKKKRKRQFNFFLNSPRSLHSLIHISSRWRKKLQKC